MFILNVNQNILGIIKYNMITPTFTDDELWQIFTLVWPLVLTSRKCCSVTCKKLFRRSRYCNFCSFECLNEYYKIQVGNSKLESFIATRKFCIREIQEKRIQQKKGIWLAVKEERRILTPLEISKFNRRKNIPNDNQRLFDQLTQIIKTYQTKFVFDASVSVRSVDYAPFYTSVLVCFDNISTTSFLFTDLINECRDLTEKFKTEGVYFGHHITGPVISWSGVKKYLI